MLKAHIDFEGGAPDDLIKQGVHRWIEHPAVQCWLMSWRIGSTGVVHRWYPGGPDPAALLEHVRNGSVVVAHNAAFERWFWNSVIRRKYCPHWPALRIEQQDCTLSRCSALSLPPSLDAVGHVLGTAHRKDEAGAALMKKMARPRLRMPCIVCGGDGCADCGGCGETFVWWNTPENIERISPYCDDDVLAETDVDNIVLPLSARERRVWELDQVINDRGITLDMDLIRRAHAIVQYGKAQLDKRIFETTGGVVAKATQVAQIKAWIIAQGVPCTTIAKGNQQELVELSEVFGVPQVEDAVAIRRERARSSTAKLVAMQTCACADNKARGQLFYHGAHTGRKAGRLIQFQNLYRIDPDEDQADINLAIEIMQATTDVAEAHDRMAVLLGEPMTMIAKCMRSMIIADRGKHLIGVDLSNIEGCSNAWLSGETWKIQAYLDYQQGNGPDLYRIAYGRSFGVDPATITKTQRQLGKIQELALGYQGSVGAYYAFTQTYLMKLAPLVAVVRASADKDHWDRSVWLFHHMPVMKQYGLPVEVWAALKIIVDKWREAHPAITQSWWDLQDAAITAMSNPTVIVDCLQGRIRYMFDKGFLWCQLPSTRLLAYPKAQLVWKDDSTLELPTGEVLECKNLEPEVIELLIRAGAKYTKKIKRQVLYEGYADEARVWVKKALYGGMQSENVNSGIARDILVDGGFDLEAAGYPVILDVHDELLTEPPLGHGSVEEVEAIMARERWWCPGFPLKAAAWEGLRYGK